VAAFITREVEEPTQVGPYLIPPNVTIQIPVWQIHHDPEIWPEPNKFDPERFHPSNKKTHHSMAWIPFGKELLGRDTSELKSNDEP
jgi:cytochrome P450